MIQPSSGYLVRVTAPDRGNRYDDYKRRMGDYFDSRDLMFVRQDPLKASRSRQLSDVVITGRKAVAYRQFDGALHNLADQVFGENLSAVKSRFVNNISRRVSTIVARQATETVTV